jgi:hypothetical protein
VEEETQATRWRAEEKAFKASTTEENGEEIDRFRESIK